MGGESEREGGRTERRRVSERRTERRETEERTDVELFFRLQHLSSSSSSASSALHSGGGAGEGRVVKMSSPCLLPAAPLGQPRLREVKISLRSRESAGAASTARQSYAQLEKEPPARVGGVSSRSRSSPAVHRASRPDTRKSTKEPQHHPERNGTLLHVPNPNPHAASPTSPSSPNAVLSPFSSSSSSSSSYTPRRRRGQQQQQQRQQRPTHLNPPALLAPSRSPSSSSTTSTSTSTKSMRRARWLSYSTSNIYFNSILDGRFRQLQGRAADGAASVCVCVKGGWWWRRW